MKSICFFPFTRINQDQAAVMGACFGTFKVLSLDSHQFDRPELKALVEEGGLVPVSVNSESTAMLDAKVQSFRDWAALHKGNENNLKALLQEGVWSTDDTDVTAIQSQIRGKKAASNPESNGGRDKYDPLLVLRFAELLDLENDSIQQRLNALDRNNARLFAELKGDDSVAGLPDQPADGEFSDENPARIAARIQAFCRVADAAGMFDAAVESTVLATTSAGVLDYLLSNSSGRINGLDIDCIKVHEQGCRHNNAWRQELDRVFEKILSGNNVSWGFGNEPCGCSGPNASLKIRKFPGKDLNDKFNIPPGTQVVVCLVKLNS